MTKKTKKEKIIAQYRRKMKLLSQMINRQENLLIKQKELSPEKKDDQKKITNVNINQIKRKDEIFDYNLISFFKEDFKKSSLISFFIIALEFLIYFVMMKNKFIK